jgi:hypothetical protein
VCPFKDDCNYAHGRTQLATNLANSSPSDSQNFAGPSQQTNTNRTNGTSFNASFDSGTKFTLKKLNIQKPAQTLEQTRPKMGSHDQSENICANGQITLKKFALEPS